MPNSRTFLRSVPDELISGANGVPAEQVTNAVLTWATAAGVSPLPTADEISNEMKRRTGSTDQVGAQAREQLAKRFTKSGVIVHNGSATVAETTRAGR